MARRLSKVVATKAWKPEFGSHHPPKKKLGMAAHTCNPRAGDMHTGGSWRLLTSHLNWINKLQVPWKIVSPKVKVVGDWRSHLTSTIGYHKKTHTHIHIGTKWENQKFLHSKQNIILTFHILKVPCIFNYSITLWKFLYLKTLLIKAILSVLVLKYD